MRLRFTACTRATVLICILALAQHFAVALNVQNDIHKRMSRGTHDHIARRAFIASLGTIVPIAASIERANAARPITREETENVGAIVYRRLRPKPPKVLRQKLVQDFAVMLMRSSYRVLDELDCVAMDQFQRDFFLIRQAEYQPYVDALGPGIVQQGFLTDPYYFDFISFAQYLAINREIYQDPPLVFEEAQPEDDQEEDKPQRFKSVVVKRDPSITNEMLGPEHGRRVGLAILEYFDQTVGATPAALPTIPLGTLKADADTVTASFTQLVKLFLINGFAWDGSASVSPRQSSIDVSLTLISPANSWSGRSLQLQNSKLLNNFICKAAEELAARLGYEVVSSETKHDGTNELTFLKLR